MMDTIPTSVIECALLDGAPPQLGDGAEWCEEHGSCEGCAKGVVDAARDELRHLKAERDRALAELDKALGEKADAVAYWQEASYKDGYDEGFASADDWLAQHEDAMAEHGWVRLPVDADGETWHLGDELTMEGEVCDVVGIGDKTIFYAFGHGVEWTIAHNNRHHHDPTVEDVLREMLDAWGELPSNATNDAIVAEYAAKLQLRGDEE